MPNSSFSVYNISDKFLFWGFSSLCILLFNLALISENEIFFLIPAAVTFFLFCIISIKHIYYLFFFLLPFSIEVELPGGVGTDLPSEPLMLMFTGFSVVLLIKNMRTLPKRFVLHPISILVLLHVCWILFATLFSTHPIVSVKFFLAKLWYVIPFFYLPFLLIKKEIEFKTLFSFLSAGVFIAVFYVMIRHALVGFSFASSYDVVRPIFRNHVNYAIMLLAYLPFLVYLSFRKKGYWIIKFCLLTIMIVAIYFSYTRAAQASVVLAIAVWVMLKFKLSKYAIGLSLIAGIIVLSFLLVNNNYLNYAPDYERAVVHKKFDNLMEATTKLEDISTVERFYRWIAGIEMVKDKPLTGFGPGTFFFEYKSHTVTSYKTYVSDNPEKSGVHNYYLMTAVEQGIIGLIILFVIIFIAVLSAESSLSMMRNHKDKMLLYAAAISLVLICIVILINDLIEADKVGPLFFLCLSIIVHFSAENRSKSL